MAVAEGIKEALERNIKAVTLRPAVGQGTKVTRVRLDERLRCEIQEGPWKLTASMPAAFGGDETSPTPGVFGRAALASCLALGYAMWAARLDVPLTSLEVEVHSDFDARGELGVSAEIRPGHMAMRYVVRVTSDASADVIERWLDIADRHSSWRDNLANPVPISREVQIAPVTAIR
jgi:uncharacterized OsmC-like protein